MVMYSDYVNAIRSMANIPPESLFILLIFVGIFWVAGKLFRALVLKAHWAILGFVALGNYGVVMANVHVGDLIQAVMLSVPLIFMAREGYYRLIRDL
jgi:hypothetical protein